MRWESQVNRFVYAYVSSTASAIGESRRVRRLRLAAAARKTRTDTIRKRTVKRTESAPAGSARCAVRGLAASIWRSASRLCAIAALRAPAIASRILRVVEREGQQRAARTAASKAKGSAKSV